MLGLRRGLPTMLVRPDWVCGVGGPVLNCAVALNTGQAVLQNAAEQRDEGDDARGCSVAR
jgi:hypothetical protein